MRASTVAGIILIAMGGFFLVRGGSLTTRRDVLKVGDLKVTADESYPVAPWMAGTAMLAGVVLVVAGVRRKA